MTETVDHHTTPGCLEGSVVSKGQALFVKKMGGKCSIGYVVCPALLAHSDRESAGDHAEEEEEVGSNSAGNISIGPVKGVCIVGNLNCYYNLLVAPRGD